MTDVIVAAVLGQIEARRHVTSAPVTAFEESFRFANIVLTIRPERQMTWDSFYDTAQGIEQAFNDPLMNETSFRITEDGIGYIGSGEVVNTRS